ncbi:hypothetical protein ACFOVU_04345 [Nocardiopsis sediminis]|uniref:Sigma-70 family RNA polymerase sigma factor n=1 Tax=Nocardiopsis sediminis TaxID=1778267 RepID=A0ABV8FKD5_9ACTN
MTTHADIGRHHADTGAEVLALLRTGSGHRRCYDAFAPDLYRYCWTLLGPDQGEEPDRAGAAVRHALLAAAHVAPELGDDGPGELRPWLFALARAAARLRGFSPRSPYADLATADSEKPAVELARRLPPSHRELLELRLRHGLAPGDIARLLGLAEETARELCASAIARAAETLSALPAPPAAAPGENTEGAGSTEEGAGGDVGAERTVRAFLAALDPPGPPATLRSVVLRDCASPLGGPERRAAATALAPLDADGYPLHRDRPAPVAGAQPAGTARPAPVAAEAGSRAASGTAGNCGSGHEDGTRTDDDTDEDMTALDSDSRATAAIPAGSRRALPADRITTRDVAAGPPEQIAELGSPHAGPDDDDPPRRLGPAGAGLIGAVILAATWGAMALLGQGGGETVDPGMPGSVLPFPIAGDDGDSTISDPAHAPHPSHEPGASRVPGEAAAEAAETVPPADNGEEHAPAIPPADTAPADPAPEPTASPSPSPEPPAAPSPPEEAPPGEGDAPEEPRSPVGRFFDDLTGLFLPRG